MNKSLGLIMDFFITLIIGILLSVFVYIQYASCISLIAGKAISLSKEVFVYAYFETVPIILLLLAFSMQLYKVRHKGDEVTSLITFILLCVFTWFCLFPLHELIKSGTYSKMRVNTQYQYKKELSGEYFRPFQNKIYYFNYDSYVGRADTIRVTDLKNPGLFGHEETLDIGPKSQFSLNCAPYRDPLIEASISTIPYNITDNFEKFLSYVDMIFSKGFIAWLCFCSLGFALSCSYVFIHISAWRLINVLICMMLFFLALGINVTYFSTFFNETRQFMNELIFGANGLRFRFFNVRRIELPLTIINMLYGALVLIIGFAIKVRRETDDD